MLKRLLRKWSVGLWIRFIWFGTRNEFDTCSEQNNEDLWLSRAHKDGLYCRVFW